MTEQRSQPFSEPFISSDNSTRHNTNDTIVNQHTLSQTTMNVVLVVLETLLTLLLRFDAPLRQLVYPLAQQNTVVCIHSYVPHVTIYATFTVNGILLDSELQPSQTVDVTINGFTWQIAQALFTNNPKVVKQLQIRGELDKVAQIEAFLQSLGLNSVIQNIIANVKGKKAEKSDKKDTEKTPSTAEYRERIKEQQANINALTIDQTELKAQNQQLISQNKFLKICLGIAILIAIGCAVGWMIF